MIAAVNRMPPMFLQADKPGLVLASSSVTRYALLHGAGLHFQARPADVDESALKSRARESGLTAGAAALTLAQAKALAVSATMDAVVIGADQILSCGDRWFDKPADLTDARAQLQSLRGKTHHLHCATICARHGQVIWSDLTEPSLTMRPFSDQVLDAYLALEQSAVLQSVGAYRLEGPGVQLFDRIEGAHTAILGLSLLPLLAFLRQEGVLR